jgi:hypothetical protein
MCTTLLSKFASVTSFRFYLHFQAEFYCIHDLQLSWLPANLIRLELNFPNVLSVVYKNELDPISLKERFPDLQELRLVAPEYNQYSVIALNDFVSQLPTGLTRLELPRGLAFPLQHIKQLPPTLQALTITLDRNEQHWVEGNQLDFSGLCELHLFEVTSYNVSKHIPRRLTTLDISFNHTQVEDALDDFWTCLPPNLTVLNTDAPFEAARHFPVPEHLTSLELLFDQSHVLHTTLSTQDMRLLPKSLRKLHVPRLVAKNMDDLFKVFVSHPITELDFSHTHVGFQDESVLETNENLFHFMSSDIVVTPKDLIPSSLRDVYATWDITACHEMHYSRLPGNLRSLKLRDSSDNESQRKLLSKTIELSLPHTLTALDLEHCPLATQFVVDTICNLPLLSKLCINPRHFKWEFMDTMTSLSLIIGPLYQSYKIGRVLPKTEHLRLFEPPVIRRWSSLRDLTIVNSPRISLDWMPQLPCSLQSLSINTTLPSNMLVALPSSLLSLNIRLTHEQLVEIDGSLLPHLTSLRLYVERGDEKVLTLDESLLKKLPKSLIYLWTSLLIHPDISLKIAHSILPHLESALGKSLKATRELAKNNLRSKCLNFVGSNNFRLEPAKHTPNKSVVEDQSLLRPMASETSSQSPTAQVLDDDALSAQSIPIEKLSVYDTSYRNSERDIKKYFPWVPEFAFTKKIGLLQKDSTPLRIPTLDQLIEWMRVPLDKDVFSVLMGSSTYKFSARSDGDDIYLMSKQPEIRTHTFQDMIQKLQKHEKLPPTENHASKNLTLASFANRSLDVWLELYMRNAIAAILYQLDGVHTVEEEANSHVFVAYVHPDHELTFLRDNPPPLGNDHRIQVKFELPVEWENEGVVRPGSPIFRIQDNFKLEHDGSLGCFCRNSSGDHFFCTANHVVTDIQVNEYDFDPIETETGESDSNPETFIAECYSDDKLAAAPSNFGDNYEDQGWDESMKDHFQPDGIRSKVVVSNEDDDVAILRISHSDHSAWCSLKSTMFLNHCKQKISELRLDENVDPKLVFKFGASTGFTVGVLGNFIAPKHPRTMWRRKILWRPDINFSTKGDSGSLVFQLINQTVIPVSIHIRGSEEGRYSLGVVFDDVIAATHQKPWNIDLLVCQDNCLDLVSPSTASVHF